MKDELTGRMLAEGGGWVKLPSIAPCSDESLDFLDVVARGLRRLAASAGSDARRVLAPLAYWMRRASLATVCARAREELLRPCGVVVHIAPGNVEVMFAYSWAIGVLTGNANVVRLPSRRTKVSPLILRAISAALEAPEGRAFEESFAFISYDSSLTSATERLSTMADVRVIWGGDQTVTSIRALPAWAGVRDVAFIDKVSLCLMDSAGVNAMADAELEELVQRFITDAWTYGQLACSSPRTIVWLGESTRARARFWEVLTESLDEQGSQMGAMNRFVTGVELAARGVGTPSFSRGVTRVWVDAFEQGVDGPGEGFFCELQIDDLGELRDRLQRRYQTVVHGGFETLSALESAVRSGALSVDRVVPIGQALEFGHVWDGYELITHLTRAIVLR